MAKKVRPGYKRCPKCDKLVKGPRTRTCPHCSHDFVGKPQGSPAPEPVVAMPGKTTKAAEVITLEHVKKVAQTVKTIGGYERFKELLDVVKEVGGLRRFRELLDAMSAAEADENKPL